MDDKNKEIVNEVVEHADKAKELLNISDQIQQVEKMGLIDPENATEITLELNDKAIAEVEKAVELQKEFLAGKDRK